MKRIKEGDFRNLAPLLMLLLNLSSLLVFGLGRGHGILPQQRIRSPNRLLHYGETHPWNTSSLELSHEYKSIGSPSRKRRRRKLSDEKIIKVHLDLEDIQMWSVLSDDFQYVDEKYYQREKKLSNKYESMRIHAALLHHESTGAQFLQDFEREHILEKIIRPSLNTWALALSVPPIQGNLTIDPGQLYDGLSCGPGLGSGFPSVLVPKDHITVGIANSDLVVYLSVSFREEIVNKVIEKYLENLPSENNEEEASQGVPIEDSSEKVLPHISTCSGTYLASATHCSTDQWDRPVAGIMNICIGSDFYEESNIEKNKVAAVHELAHILGFSSHSLAHFRDFETGKPITQRDSSGDVRDVEVECTGTSRVRRREKIPLPSRDLLQFKNNVRGGLRVAQIVTPNVKAVVRNHFDCQTIEGAELESSTAHVPLYNSTQGFDCISDHWERRLFKSDLMNPIIDSVTSSTHISPLTLAYFKDSGWYKVNVTRSAEPDLWGRASGCEFVEENCLEVDKETPTFNEYFCRKSRSHGCTDDMRGKASCRVGEYFDLIPEEYRYFNENPYIGGIDPYLDFCPIYGGHEETLCSRRGAKNAQMDAISKNSKCIHGNDNGKASEFCIPLVCSIEEKVPYLRVDGLWSKCEYEGQFISSWYDTHDYVICPNPLKACPSLFCPQNCFFDDFTGLCNYEDGTCSCPSHVWENDFDRCNSPNIFPMNTLYLSEIYINDTSTLENEDKDIFNHVKRIFISMEPGEVLGFFATSLVAIGAIFVLGAVAVKFFKRPIFCPSLNNNKEWLTENVVARAFTSDENRRNNKDKMVASVLHNLRIESAANGLQTEGIDERVFTRSEMPPLPVGLVRVIDVVGSRFVDDSVIPSGNDDGLTIEGTTNDSRTSKSDDLNTINGIEGDNTMIEMISFSQKSAEDQTRFRGKYRST